ncbi:MAG: cyclase family protein [Actinomycetia bacterium]|nr:cyclase family protein [Actinomycetes bacterium]
MSGPTLGEFLQDAPKNWGRWGPDDELGCLNFLDAAEVVRGAAEIREGQVFTLGTPITHPTGDPAFPGLGRSGPKRTNSQDYGDYLSGAQETLPGGLEFADDVIELGTHSSTHFDALGHAWFDGACWNGYPPETTIGGMQKASVLPIAEHGVVGRGVVLDIARLKGKPHLERGEPFTHDDLLQAAERQGITIERRDVVLIRTGCLGHFYDVGPEEYLATPFLEAGLAYSDELVFWYQERELPVFATDTISGEYTDWETTGYVAPLHASLMRNLGVLFSEIMWLDDLAAACADDGRWTFFFAAAPLKIVEGTGALVNPLAIR